MKLFTWKCQNKDETSREIQLVEIRRKWRKSLNTKKIHKPSKILIKYDQILTSLKRKDESQFTHQKFCYEKLVTLLKNSKWSKTAIG